MAALALAGAAPGRGQALVVTEAGAGALAVVAHRGFWGPEVGVARRPGGETRVAVSVAGGDAAGVLGVRLQATGQMLLRPAERSAVSPYGGLGLAFVGTAATHGAGYLTALFGVESAPGRRAGWYAELGLGGGVRLAVGARWRHFPAWW
ncbi:MAG TPA: hypothetical protein VEU55_06400 [Gemmatimonadales bacterium]|nr:hypothetical protein [Gemmatimonadales bacterium]